MYLFVYLLLSAYLVASNIANSVTLPPSDRAALTWVKAEIPAESRFIVMTGAGAVTDPLAEWFPALTQSSEPQHDFWLGMGAEYLVSKADYAILRIAKLPGAG